jgi:hypothetical protein
LTCEINRSTEQSSSWPRRLGKNHPTLSSKEHFILFALLSARIGASSIFAKKNAPFFFGREAAIDKLADAVQQQ